MAANKDTNDLILDKVMKGLSDTQVKPKRHYSARRFFDMASKLRILSEYDACENTLTRGALLRREGIYHSRISAWRQQLKSSRSGGQKKLRTDHLIRENERLKKKLAQAEAIIDLQKKVSELLGTHILPHESSEENS